MCVYDTHVTRIMLYYAHRDIMDVVFFLTEQYIDHISTLVIYSYTTPMTFLYLESSIRMTWG